MGSRVGINFIDFVKRYCRCHRKYISGHTVLEITIALFLTSLLTLSGFQWLQVVKKEWIKRTAQISHDKALRNIFLYLSQDIEQCKYLGMRSQDSFFPIKHHLHENHILYRYQLLPRFRFTDKPYPIYRSVSGFTAPFVCQTVLPDTLCHRLSSESDVLIVHLIGKAIAHLGQDLLHLQEALYTQEKHTIRKGSLVLISDLIQGDLFIANDISSNRIYHQQTSMGNFSGHLSKCYRAGTEVRELQNVAYYVSQNVLFRDDFLHAAQEIVTGIESFKVEYGLMNQNKIQFKKGNTINETEWKDVRCIRITIKTLYDVQKFEYEFAIPNRYRLAAHIDFNHSYIAYCKPSIAAISRGSKDS